MKIHKILNNNVIVSINEHNKEIIAMGKGIAFKKKIGDVIDDEVVDKVYTLSDDTSLKFQEILADIPIEHLSLSDDIINYAKLQLGKKLSDKIYISLSDHISTAITRFLDGIEISNFLLWDIKRFYKDEFLIGLKAIDMIEEKCKIRLPEDEAGFIALHIVNCEMDEDLDNVYEMTKAMQEILNIVKYYFNTDFDEESVYFYRFITHLKFFAQRLITKKTFNDEQDDGLLEIIKNKHHNAYQCSLKIKQFLLKKYNYDLSDEEMLYLTIHISRIIYKNEKKSNNN